MLSSDGKQNPNSRSTGTCKLLLGMGFTFPRHNNIIFRYYEGKEFETKLKAKKPGQLSEELKAALNMPPLAPPPWLINMQRYGPPPSYPQLKIPGLNAPIPEGAQWGYHPGGWGKPPVDEYGRPLYGDVFGTMAQEVHLEVTRLLSFWKILVDQSAQSII